MKIKEHEITPEIIFNDRRNIIKAIGAGAIGASVPLIYSNNVMAQTASNLASLKTVATKYKLDDKITSYQDITSYNNFYEFGTDKSDPGKSAKTLKTTPWSITVEGLVAKPKTFGIEDLFKLAPLEERIYRLRCVEGWSMVIPWVGYSLSELIKQVQPLGSAKFVEFISLADPSQMPELRSSVLDWPYTEGLRLDEAMHPLTLLTLGLYGKVLPQQNGAPVRLTVPWKYGFKSAKSIVKIRFTDKMPKTAWIKAAAQEYGFYSNVNPNVDHPRWSQATERKIGETGLFTAKKKTLMFNGYEEVAPMYAGMDLKKLF